MSTAMIERLQEGSPSASVRRQIFMGMPFDQISYADVVEAIRRARDAAGFRYIVTPNVDHVVRLAKQPELRKFYDNAWLTVCDSKPVAVLARAVPLVLPRVTGADLTSSVFSLVIKDGDRISVIAPNQEVVETMRAKYPQLRLRAHVPPFGVSENPLELQRCVDFITSEPNDFVFLAIGSPQSEKIAFAAGQEDRATGTCFCIGAALEFMTGIKVRAPRWMSKSGLEWLHRLASDPRRLWRRYLLSVPPLLQLATNDIVPRWKARLLGG